MPLTRKVKCAFDCMFELFLSMERGGKEYPKEEEDAEARRS
jgi:hypothetical protein